MKKIYFSFIHSFISYCNIVWGSTNYGKLKKLHSKQKHACRIVFGAHRTFHCEPLLRKLGSLSFYKLNIHQVLQFMFKTKHGFSPIVFQPYFSKISHKYPTKSSINNFVVPKTNLKLCSYQIQYRGPFLWKHFSKFITKNNNGLNISFEQFRKDSKRFLLQKDFDLKYLF